MHPSIKFTKEHEENNRLAFLDVEVQRRDDHFQTSVFRKNTFTGLSTSYFSYCCKVFKTNGIMTLLHRAYNVCSTPLAFKKELSFLKTYFYNNGFPTRLVESMYERFLGNKLDFHLIETTVPRKQMYFSLPYFGHQSVLFSMSLTNLIKEHFPHIEPRMSLNNNFSIGSFFKIKEALPQTLRSSLVYKFSCPQLCGSVYIGSTIRTLKTRIFEHKGVSVRTDRPLAKPSQSSVRSHCEQCSGGSVVSSNSFEILSYCHDINELRILESLFIFKLKPCLNETNSAFPLKIVNN